MAKSRKSEKKNRDTGFDDESFGLMVFNIVGGKPRFLLLRHHKGGHWSPPKGHSRGSESPLEAARRETLEECGLEPDNILENHAVSIEYDLIGKKGKKKRKRVTFFPAEAPPDAFPTLSFEHTEWAWMSPEEAAGMVFDNIAGAIRKVAGSLASR